MVAFLTAALAISIVGMTTILALKRYEMNTGRVILSGARPALGTFFHNVFLFVKALPLIVRYFAHWGVLRIKSWLQRGIAQASLMVESQLERMLHTVREKTAPPRAEGEASAFLREVADHKKELSKRSRKERRIVE